jgi:O-antigen ligase
VTAGVSSVYLLVAEQTGFLGLGAYLAALLTTWWAGAHALARPLLAGQSPEQWEQLQGVQAALLAALSGALVAGMLDQYFANQTFPHAVALFWLYAALLVAASRLGRPALLAGGRGLVGDQNHVSGADRISRQLARR